MAAPGCGGDWKCEYFHLSTLPTISLARKENMGTGGSNKQYLLWGDYVRKVRLKHNSMEPS